MTDQSIYATYLKRALELAEAGRGRVSPNPLVGAVIERDGSVIGEGFHAELGGSHAERAALEDCRSRGHDPAGATMYVTLEPCDHQGRQPPCSRALIDAGLVRVVIASEDPSEKASGAGPARLTAAGVDIEWWAGEEAERARLLNQPFRKHARTGRPLVIHKVAASLDGRTTGATRRWISGEQSRRLIHRWRAELDAIAVGIGTALADDPLLTAREIEVHRQPLRVVFDRRARLPVDSALVDSVARGPVLLITSEGAPADRVEALRERGVEVEMCPGTAAEFIGAALELLGSREVTSLLLEGGATLAAAFSAAGEVDEMRLFIAPVLLGGRDAPPILGPDGAGPRDALDVRWQTIGSDLLASARLREW